jgi:hypothetical protein
MIVALQGESISVDAGEQLPHLVRFRRSAIVLKIQYFSDAPMGIDSVRSFLTLKDESEGFRDPA